jgi:diguanylate cyclase (GGDEF)-like protein/PAS domain S-box-containing protein
VFRVPVIEIAALDWRLVVFAGLIAAAASVTALHALGHARDRRGRARAMWLLLAGAGAGAGIWATHFLAVRAYEWGAPTTYDSSTVTLVLLVGIAVTTAGFALSAADGRIHALAGGAVIGAGLVLVHVIGMKALQLPATLHRSSFVAVPVHMAAVALCCAAMVAYRELGHRRALWAAAGLLTLAICGLHLVAVGAMTVIPDPTRIVSASAISGPTLAIVVACTTAALMMTSRVATLIAAQTSREAELDLRRRHEALQRREQELKQQNLRFDMALSSLPHGLSMVDAERRLVVCNKRFADMYGIPPELSKPGMPIDALVEHCIASGVYATHDAQAFREELRGQVTKPTLRTRYLNGGRVVLVSRRPTPDGGWIAVHEDITEHRRLQQTEREAKEALAAVFDAAPAAIICVAIDRRVVLWSRGAEHIFGFTAEETVGQPYKLVPLDGKSEFDALFERALAGDTLRNVHMRHRRKDGTLVEISLSCAPMRARDGEVRGIVYALDDLTEREKLSARLEAQHRLLKQREERLKAQNEQLDAALANMVQGLAMFDKDERLVLANARYAELFGLTPEEARPGTTLREIIERRAAKGLYPGETVDEVLSRLRQHIARGIASHLVSLADGRLLSASVKPRADGGWVVTLHDISEQDRLKKQLEARNEQLDAALNNMSQGLAMFDREQRLVICNRRYAQMYGLTLCEVKPGTTVRQTLESRLKRGLYEAPDIVDKLVERFGQLTSDTHKLTDGRTIHLTYQRTASGGYVVTHEDMTAREQLMARLAQQHELLKAQEEKLKAQNVQLDAALNNMVQGVAMFDADHRLIMCNRLYAEMYGLTPEQVKPGTTVRQIFEYRMARGTYHVKDQEKFVESWIRDFGEKSSHVQELSDGRIIAVSRSQMAEGGRVITHEDITERQKLHAQLERQHELLKEHEEKLKAQNMQLDAALNNMVQGLAMFDADMRIVVANKRYAELYDLAPDQVRPGTHLREIIEHRIANGDLQGRDADEVMRSVLARMSATGESQYTTRLDNGRYIVVSSKPMASGFIVTTHQDITEQRRSEAKIVHMALHDALTGLPNRALFNERLDHSLSRARRGDIVAVHLLDLDHFKNVNDTLGHPAGDKLLKAVSERLRKLVRETDTIARMGGDEFAILQTAIPQGADAGALARRVIDAVSESYDIDGHQMIVGTSVGIALAPTDGITPDQLIRNADLALYRAKGDGRGIFSFFEPGMDAKMQERRVMEYDLRKALMGGEFELFYQPVVNLSTNKISGFEALIRWRHPERGLISPAAFIPLAEEIGFIIPLGDWAIRQACATAARWPKDVKVAVNLSPVQFRSAGLVQTVVNALAASGLAPERLELEITETTLLQDSEETLATLYRLREIGVSIAMDDFGTGYSSLSYLQSFPFDRIKIDRSFIQDIADGVGSLNIVRAVAALARGLGMETTAEGVETELQREKVASEGCTEMQGFLFSQPRPADEIERLYFPELGKEQDTRPADIDDKPMSIAARAGAR